MLNSATIATHLIFVSASYIHRSSNDDEGKTAGQFWTTMDAFPPATMTPYYLHGDGTASLEPPASDTTPSTSFVYDPSDVIPTQGGNNLFSDAPCGKYPDRRKASLLEELSTVEGGGGERRGGELGLVLVPS